MIKKLFSNIATVLGIIIIYTTVWTIDNFGHASIDEILFTISSPIKGFDYNLAFSYLYFILLLCFLYELIFILLFRIKKYEFKKIYLLISIGVFIFGCYYLECNFNVVNYLSVSYTQTDIYSKESSYDPAIYVNPEEVKITGEKTNNLIFIYLESIENTFADIKNGGINEINFIPELTDLAKDNVSFSNTSLLGGPFNTSGSTWTIGSMVCQMGGLPLKNLIGNNMSEYDYFMPNCVMLGDILKQHNYLQEFIMGQDSTFAGTNILFKQHGDYNIYELSNIQNDYEVKDEALCPWGIHDYLLFDVVKDRLSIINENAKQQNRNFNVTIATIDSHCPDGYKCPFCNNIYNDDYYNVVSCQSKLVNEFVEWCKTQDWYANTTIIIVGDHPTMAEKHLKNINVDFERTSYNCFINSKVEALNTNNRIFTRFDIYPTTLAALGFKIENEKLALGTNLFSNVKTNAETYGIDFFRKELEKSNHKFERYIYSNN